MNNVGESCAGEPHARFDGRALETDPTRHGERTEPPARETAGTRTASYRANGTAPALYPTILRNPG